MHDDVRPELDRTRQHRRRCRRVDCDHRADRSGNLARRGNVRDLPRRIRRGFYPDEAWAARPRLFREIVERGIGIEVDRQSPRGGGLQQPVPQRPVHVAWREDAIAWRERLEDRGRGGLTRGKQHRRRCAFQRRKQRLGLIVPGIVWTRIRAAPRIVTGDAAFVGRCHMNGRNDFAERRCNAPHALRGKRFKMQRGFFGGHFFATVGIFDAPSLRERHVGKSDRWLE